MPEGRIGGAMSVEGFIAGGGLEAVDFVGGRARSSTLGFLASFVTGGAGFAVTRAVALLGPVFFTAFGLSPGREVERAIEEERVERAGWAISPRAYHCPRFGVNGERADRRRSVVFFYSSSSRLGSLRPVRRASGLIATI